MENLTETKEHDADENRAAQEGGVLEKPDVQHCAFTSD